MTTPPGDSDPATRPDASAGPQPADEVEFTVPLPHREVTQALPSVSDTQVLPTPPPPPPAASRAELQPPTGPWGQPGPTPYADGSTLPAAPGSPVAGSAGGYLGAAPAGLPTGLFTVGLVLLGVLAGWWLFFGVRLIWWLVQVGATSTTIISTIDAVPEETVVAVAVALLTVLALGIGWARDAARRGTGLVVAAGGLALATVVIAVWRLT